MIPLWMTATRPSWLTWGWALLSVGPPCVAQRVWPIPVVESGMGSLPSRVSRLASLPAFLRTSSMPSLMTATPAESYPRYSRRRRPATMISRACF